MCDRQEGRSRDRGVGLARPALLTGGFHATVRYIWASDQVCSNKIGPVFEAKSDTLDGLLSENIQHRQMCTYQPMMCDRDVDSTYM